jgi:ATP-dependent Zn protease
MKQMHFMRSVILSTLLLNISIQSETNPSKASSLSATEEAQIAEITAFAEAAVKKAFHSLQKIENKLTEIALVVHKSTTRNLAMNPVTIMQVLTDNKMTINALLQNQAAISALKDPVQQLEIAFVITEFCNAFIPYLNKQISEKFKNAKPFNLNKFLQNLHKGKNRSNLSHLEPQALTKRLKVTRDELNALETTVKNMGLTWYNKVARTLDSWVVTPANKCHIPTIALYTASVGFMGLYSLWHYADLCKNNKNLPEWLRDFVKEKLLADDCGPLGQDRAGFPYIIGADTDDSHNNRWGRSENFHANTPDNACTLAVVDLEITNVMSGKHPLLALAGGATIASFVKMWNEQGGLRDRLTKKRDAVWNFLRGGEYLNTYQPGLTQMKPSVTFDHMVGLDEVKEAFYSIIQYIDNPEQLMRIEATPEKGWLLTGPPRTGKTFSVECLCGEIEKVMAKRGQANKMKFFNINASLVNEYGIKAILDEVYENAPAVIFIDEIDLLGLQRVGNNKLLSDFLTAMQSSMNADPSKIVIVIAATNRPENIDSALRQNGRFGKEIRFDYPSRKYRVKFLIRELVNMALNVKEFDIETLADKTNDKTFEDLKRVIRNAMTRSWMHGSSLTQELLEESIDTEINNLIMFNRKDLPENEVRIVATHFAGMALAAMHLATHELLDKVTTYAYMANIKDEGVWENYSKKEENSEQKKIEYGKFITKQPHDTINVKTENTIINEATLLLAGFAAEELLIGPCGFTCHRNDRDKAYKLIEELIFGGLLQEALPKSVREELKLKAFMLQKQCQKNAMDILVEHKDALMAIVEELMKKQILSDKEIKAIIDKIENPSPVVIPEASATEDDQNQSLDDIFEETHDESVTQEDKQEDYTTESA